MTHATSCLAEISSPSCPFHAYRLHCMALEETHPLPHYRFISSSPHFLRIVIPQSPCCYHCRSRCQGFPLCLHQTREVIFVLKPASIPNDRSPIHDVSQSSGCFCQEPATHRLLAIVIHPPVSTTMFPTSRSPLHDLLPLLMSSTSVVSSPASLDPSSRT